MTCDPCQFCANLIPGGYAYEDGWECDECRVESEFDPDEHRPCNDFRPRLVSDDLLQQISDEEEYRFYSTCDCKKTDCTGCQWNGNCDRQTEREVYSDE